MQVEIMFIKDGANSALGGFVRGGKARVSAAFAKHLVDEVGVAVYSAKRPNVPEIAPIVPETEPNSAVAPKRKGKK